MARDLKYYINNITTSEAREIKNLFDAFNLAKKKNWTNKSTVNDFFEDEGQNICFACQVVARGDQKYFNK